MSEPLTLERFERFEKDLHRNLDERFGDLALAVADVVTRVNDHTDERLMRLEMRQRIERMQLFLAEKFGRDELGRAGL